MTKNILTESTKSKFKILENKPKNVLKRIQGVLSDFKSNRNGRIYPRELWENVLNSDYVKEMIESHGLVGELDHPEERLEISLQNVSHVINDMWIEGDQVLGTIDILPTPSGKIVSELLDYGTDIGISSRGAGSVGSNNVVDSDYQFVTFDFVARPSCEAARLNTILESVQPEIDTNSDDKVKSILEGYKTDLKEDEENANTQDSSIKEYMEKLESIRKSLSEDDAEGLDMVLDDIEVDPETCALSDLEDAVHSSVFKFNDANSFEEYSDEEFYGREYNADNIYKAIIKLYNRDKDIEESLGYRPDWLDESLTEAAKSDQEVYRIVLNWYKQQIDNGKMTLNQCKQLLSDKAKVSLDKLMNQQNNNQIRESLVNSTINKLIKESIDLNKTK